MLVIEVYMCEMSIAQFLLTFTRSHFEQLSKYHLPVIKTTLRWSKFHFPDVYESLLFKLVFLN